MKRVVALALCVSLAAPGAAADIATVLMPSPLTILLTIGKWMKKDQVEVFYVQVQAHGRDEQDARDQAFRLAVNQAVGSLMLSQTQVQAGQVQRHEIINYSSGYVHDFKILDRSYGSGVTIKVDVWVSRSSIADRLLGESRTAGSVEGGRITEQIRSFQHERKGADSVIDAMLRDYPARAFDITIGKTAVAMDSNRRPILQIPFRLAWNEKFTKAFFEATRAVSQHPECGGWFDPCINRRYTQVGAGYFDDEVIYQKVFKAMYSAVAKIRILAADGTVQYSECAGVPELGADYSPWKFVDVGGGRVILSAGRWKDYVWAVDLSRIPTNQLDRVEVLIENTLACSP